MPHIEAGIVENRAKSMLLPAQQGTYLELELVTQAMRTRLCGEEVSSQEVSPEAGDSSAGSSPLVPSPLGMMASGHPVVRLGLLHMRRLQSWFARL